MALNSLYLQSFPLMKSASTVSVCSSNNGKKNKRKDVFMSTRQYFSKQKQCSMPHRTKATFFSELRPVSQTELQSETPESFGITEQLEEDGRICDKFEGKNEMKSSFLMRNRDSQTFSKRGQYLSFGHNLDSQFRKSKTFDLSNIKTSDFGNHFKIKLLKKTDTDIGSNNKSINEKLGNFPPQIKTVKSRGMTFSVSNSITNVLTIDDIYRSKSDSTEKPLAKLTIQKFENKNPPVENKNKTVRNEPVKSKREAILSDYVNVYLNWRAAKSIEEHFDVAGEKDVQNRVRSATPKCRLQIFQRILNEKQATMPTEKIYEYNRTSKTVHSGFMKDEYNVDTLRFPVLAQNEAKKTSIDQEKSDRTDSVKENKRSLDDSDRFSEIDWLECENF